MVFVYDCLSSDLETFEAVYVYVFVYLSQILYSDHLQPDGM